MLQIMNWKWERFLILQILQRQEKLKETRPVLRNLMLIYPLSGPIPTGVSAAFSLFHHIKYTAVSEPTFSLDSQQYFSRWLHRSVGYRYLEYVWCELHAWYLNINLKITNPKSWISQWNLYTGEFTGLRPFNHLMVLENVSSSQWFNGLKHAIKLNKQHFYRFTQCGN